MRVFYDGIIYDIQRTGGINRYFTNLINALPPDAVPLLSLRREIEMLRPQHPALTVHVSKQYRFRPRRIARQLETLLLAQKTSTFKFDVAHPTYYHLLTEKPLGSYRCPTVITIYDMIYELFSDTLPEADKVIALKRQAIEAAQAILCISESTRRDLLSFYPAVEQKVFVTPLASDITAQMGFRQEPVPCRPYFLHVGNRTYYKNFSQLLLCFSQIVPKHSELALCVVGTPFSDEERSEIAALGLEAQVEHFGFVDDEHLAKLYRGSLALVYPSRYEGFGIPLLEAMTCDTVVIAANRSSIPEVTGEAALLFDPDVPDTLTDLLRAVSEGMFARNALVEKGRQQAQKFSWARTAVETATVYRTLC